MLRKVSDSHHLGVEEQETKTPEDSFKILWIYQVGHQHGRVQKKYVRPTWKWVSGVKEESLHFLPWPHLEMQYFWHKSLLDLLMNSKECKTDMETATGLVRSLANNLMQNN